MGKENKHNILDDTKNDVSKSEEQETKETAQKVGETAKETASNISNAVQLVLNIVVSKNVGGAIKNGINIAKTKQGKRVIIGSLISAVIPIILVIALIVFLASSLFGVFNAVGEFVDKMADEVVEFFNVDWENDGVIKVTDEEIDTIINGIEGMGISIEGLRLMGDIDYSNPDIQAETQEQARKYIRKFYEAQAMTQTINTKPNLIGEAIDNIQGEVYGTVYLHRISDENDVKKDGTIKTTNANQLAYIKYEDMVTKRENGDNNITKYFSIDEEGQLVIPYETKVEIKDNSQTVTSTTTTIELKHIDYKNEISQYTTPLNFFIYLTMITQNPEFASAVTELVKQSEIRIAVMDTQYVRTIGEVYKETINEVKAKEKKEVETESGEEVTKIEEGEVKQTLEPKGFKITTTTTTEPQIEIAYAKTWFCEQEITYKQTTIPRNPNPSNRKNRRR